MKISPTFAGKIMRIMAWKMGTQPTGTGPLFIYPGCTLGFEGNLKQCLYLDHEFLVVVVDDYYYYYFHSYYHYYYDYNWCMHWIIGLSTMDYIYICIHTYIHTYIHIYIHTDRMIIITNIHLHARPTWNCLQASSPPSGPRGPCWTPVLWDIIFVNWKIDVEWSVYYGTTREHQFLKVDNAPLLLNSISVSPFCQWENVGTSLSNRCLNGWIVRGKHLGKFRATGGSWNGLFLIREWSSGFGG